ncbi:MAG TPA: cytochrome c family protein [Methylovirgula sp.]
MDSLDSFEFNKMAGALLGALLFTVGTGILSDAIFSHHELEKPGYALPSAPEGGGAGGEKPAAGAPLADLLAKADPKRGEADTRPCQACHNFEKGAGVKIGPPLYGVVGRPKGSIAGFDYSAGMKAKGGNWTYEDINTFITDPKAFVSGTKMTFSGVPDAEKRADILSYLRTLSDNPVPFPKPAPAKAPAPTKASEPAPQKTQAPAPAPGGK